MRERSLAVDKPEQIAPHYLPNPSFCVRICAYDHFQAAICEGNLDFRRSFESLARQPLPSLSLADASRAADLVAIAALFAEKILKKRRAFGLQNTACNLALMIEGVMLEQIHYRARGSGADVGTAKNHPPNPRVNNRPRTHRTRFLCYVKVAVSQAPVADRGLGRC
jgi:hypothetical protein